MSLLAYRVSVLCPGYSTQLRQTPDEEYKAHVHIHADHKEDDDRPIHHHNKEAQTQNLGQ